MDHESGASLREPHADHGSGDSLQPKSEALERLIAVSVWREYCIYIVRRPNALFGLYGVFLTVYAAFVSVQVILLTKYYNIILLKGMSPYIRD